MPKRRTRASRGCFQVAASSTPVIVNYDLPLGTADGSLTPHSINGENATEKRATNRFRLKLRSSSARLFSRLGLWNSRTSGASGDTFNDGNESSKNYKNILSPALLPRLSRKLSIFGPSTVIRRTKLKPRPGISNVDGVLPLMSLNISDDIAHSTSDHSTYMSTVFSKADYRSSLDGVSTSLMLAAQPADQNTVQAEPPHPSGQCGTSTQPLPQLKLQLSIVTVEATAAAKIFFETHFNSLLSGQDAREQRLRELHEHFYTLPFTEEEQNSIKKAWIAQESEHLRQTRVLKSHSNRFNHHKDTISVAGYEPIKVLGQGSFGIVRLVKKKMSFAKTPPTDEKGTSEDPQHVYAMKVIRKSEMIKLCQEGHIRAEREFLASSERSKWIVPLIASFQDTGNLYLIMEYEVGGDFFNLLIRHGVLSERDAVWYISEMILCVEEAHRLGWIHRDVKPENFLISANGHLKIADFGLAFDGHWAHNQAYFQNHRYSLLEKLGIEVDGDTKDELYQRNVQGDPPHAFGGGHVLDWRNRNEKRRFARSIVGTSQYMAPEIIAGEAYDGRCDYWSIGIILYECLYGMTPFYRENRHDTKRCILHHRTALEFPQERFSDLVISYHAIDLIQQLLQIKEFRLSSKQYRINDCFLWPDTVYNPMDPPDPYYKRRHVYPDDASDIKAHRLFRGIPWSEMLYEQPPYIPDVKNQADTSYFDEILNPELEIDKSEKRDADLASNQHSESQAAKEISCQTSHPNPIISQSTFNVETNIKRTVSKKNGKESRGARDRILRDKNVGSTALDVRTRVAFMGYTWRRPKPVRDVLETKRGRCWFAD
ncbi:kinase-like domain-containing protein [Talaromyces proteolyticus]|uniref:non-specific serine/threonine protein kinase n=1 Tax=Talaromyces proteolyticus TaxID=1131652 RepID=A0AAD4L2T6_9EURO|nr:kinase-like domain-containing protein [Talaromyces proteolyticus]KAH8704887.1 kinase-like domain-containing protein [Talaromyces proteolyticus]